MKTLYVTDLDGTLLNCKSEVSDFTVNTINALVARGMCFSYATARSYTTASQVTSRLTARMPVIVYNGVFILEQGTGKRVLSNTFSAAEASIILSALKEAGVTPVVYSLIDGTEKYSFCLPTENPGIRTLLRVHPNDARERAVTNVEELLTGDCYCFSCFDSEETLKPLYERFKEIFQCWYFYADGQQRLQLRPRGAAKGNAILSLKQLLNCDRVVCFGDGNNDFQMFDVADECYAMKNADEELKKRATAVIDSNDEDGVAKWLLEHVSL